jgi:hypothetical protein
MKLRINIAISLVSLMTICWSVRFAIAQERRREPEYLPGMYQDLNKKFFDGALPAARVEWADLTRENTLGETYLGDDDVFVVLVDRNSNLLDGELEDTIEHETCHIATWQQEYLHGPLFQACMARIKATK